MNVDRETQTRHLAANTPPMTTWHHVADWVDDATWDRILGDLAPSSYAEAVACRPRSTDPLPTPSTETEEETR